MIDAGVSDWRTTASPVTAAKTPTTARAMTKPSHGEATNVLRPAGASGIVVILIAAGVHRIANV